MVQIDATYQQQWLQRVETAVKKIRLLKVVLTIMIVITK